MRSKISKFPGGLTPNLAFTSDCALRPLLQFPRLSTRPLAPSHMNVLTYYCITAFPSLIKNYMHKQDEERNLRIKTSE